MIVLIEKLLLLITSARDCQLDLAGQTLVNPRIYHYVPCPQMQSVLYPHDPEFIILVDLILSEQVLNYPKNLVLIGVDLASQQIEDLEGHHVDRIEILSGLTLEILEITSKIVLLHVPGDLKQTMNELIQLRADIG